MSRLNRSAQINPQVLRYTFVSPRGSMRRRFLLPTFLLCFSAIAAAPAPTGFRSLTWGSRVPEGLKKLTGPTSDGTSLYVPRAGGKVAPLFGLPVAEEAYSFTHGKFYSGSAWFDGRGNFEKAKAALMSAYGQPTFANPSMDLYKWKWPGSKVEVHLYYQAKFARTTVTFLNNAI